VFNCKPEWPICLFDFTIKSKIPNFFVYRVKRPLDSFKINDYFNGSRTGGDYRPSTKPDLNADNLLIERNHHLCHEHPMFEKNFKMRFAADDPDIYQDHRLNRVFDSEKELEKAKREFI
jgi:hypothetical protein